MLDSDSGMIPLLAGIGIRNTKKAWNWSGIKNFLLESELESESGFQRKSGIGIRIKTWPESCITDIGRHYFFPYPDMHS